jgi:tetratricopeptide (TPR) repeat protein
MESVSHTFDLALQHHQGGNLRQAELLYRQILQINPRHANARHLLGVIAHQVGRDDLAVDYIQQALRLHPDFPSAYNNLGAALTDLGRLDEAITSYQQAVRLKPKFAEAYNNLGNALRVQGRLEEAIASIQQALRLNPDFPGAHNHLGNALKDQGKLDEAMASYREALRLKPNYAEALANLGNVRAEQGRLDEAITNIRQAVRLRPDLAALHSHLGGVLTDQGQVEEAITSYREALRLKPTHADSMSQLASMLRGKLPDADRTILEQRLMDSNLNDADRAKLLFGLAEVCDAKGEYIQAAAHLRQANALSLFLHCQKGQAYDLNENTRFVENLMKAFTPAFFERVRGFGLETERPVFIVGLPRSGTTLTEQILAAHSQVHGAGELSLGRMDFLDLGTHSTDESVFAAIPELPGDAFHRQAQRHLDYLATINGTAARIVDKMPNNYCYLGLLAALFPRAKFIHCRRDLRDVAVSCWMTNFRYCQWAYDPEHIAAHFRDYQRLMEHWRTVLPVSVLEVQYEDTVTDLPGQAQRMVEWCGLDWEPGCLKFNEGIRPVRTASKIQVREPIYTRSVARWRNYEAALSALFAALKRP